MVIQRIMVPLSHPHTHNTQTRRTRSFEAKVIQLRCDDASVSFKEIAESHINHCLELAHLPRVFCILATSLSKVCLQNWGEWQSGSKRRAAPSIWRRRRGEDGTGGGWPYFQSQSCRGDEEGEERCRNEDYHPVCFLQTLLLVLRQQLLTKASIFKEGKGRLLIIIFSTHLSQAGELS